MFVHIPTWQDGAQVYAWVSGQDILYIGQAGKGLQKRHREHRAGWQNGSATGIKLAGPRQNPTLCVLLFFIKMSSEFWCPGEAKHVLEK